MNTATAYLLDTNVVLHATRQASPFSAAVDAQFQLRQVSISSGGLRSDRRRTLGVCAVLEMGRQTAGIAEADARPVSGHSNLAAGDLPALVSALRARAGQRPRNSA